MPLICNPMLPILAILITTKAFQDYETIDDLLAIQPSVGEMVHLQWKKGVRDLPFFKSTSARSAPRKIESATAFGKRLRHLGFRAGYPRPPTIHDFRAEGLYLIGTYRWDLSLSVSNIQLTHHLPQISYTPPPKE